MRGASRVLKKGSLLPRETRGRTAILNAQVLKERSLLTLLNEKPNARVCIQIGLHGLGDCIMGLPILQFVRKHYPNAHITAAVWKSGKRTGNPIYKDLLLRQPYINEIVYIEELIPAQYDKVVRLETGIFGYERPEVPVVARTDYFARQAGIDPKLLPLAKYVVADDEAAWANAFFERNDLADKKVIALHTASEEDRRCWKPERYVEFVISLAQKHPDVRFLVFDANGVYTEWYRHTNCVLVSNTTVRQMAALIARSSLFIGPDSGPMHIAGAVSVKSYVLFGSIPPAARIARYPTHEAVRNEALSCLGCWYKECTIGFKCMSSIQADDLYERIRGNL